MSGGLRRSSCVPLMNGRPPQELLDGLLRFQLELAQHPQIWMSSNIIRDNQKVE
ncbi:hypothetical protein CCACVL1_28451 [Corchorus capsularis]|uniref:Uncharacterized protein n=1 Tax=Corchorus capsularis TaxID=210143 RepID=A0A1R3G6P1_COCAP|nr:hypothetical protein CCACVL1_28451 [Corchorus capsularis]